MSELNAWVDKLGAMSTKDIRELMRAEGVRGLQGVSQQCPIARFLGEKGCGSVDVDAYDIETATQCLPTPPSVCDFIADFDGGDYPELSLLGEEERI